jgi:cytochrome c-type biogenesis protein CcmE
MISKGKFMRRRTQRSIAIVVGGVLLVTATALVLTALEQNIVYFYSPSDLAEAPVSNNARIRIGGLVEEGSVETLGDGATQFRVTDGVAVATVQYTGILPDLFREGQGIVAEGQLQNRDLLIATNVLAKHDETYMPPEVADALKRAGTWRGEGAASP